jgi:hypothetical protein
VTDVGTQQLVAGLVVVYIVGFVFRFLYGVIRCDELARYSLFWAVLWPFDFIRPVHTVVMQSKRP